MWKKKVADGLTVTRCILALILVWLGFSQGTDGFPMAVAVLLTAWITDVLDGPLARSSGVKTQTWVGAHDIFVDTTMGVATLVYLHMAGFVDARVAIAYLLIWAIIFWRLRRLPKAFGALFQGPIYLWFMWISLQQAPEVGLLLVLYGVVYIVTTWKQLMHRLVPEFFHGLQDGLTSPPRTEHNDLGAEHSDVEPTE